MSASNPPRMASETGRKKDSALNLRPGETVLVLSENEILATLDKKGTLDGLPLMPTMHEYCGKKFNVLRRADKIMVEGFGVRRMKNTVILEGPTCNGEVQGGCSRTCFVLWKEAWLRRTKNIQENHVAPDPPIASSDANVERSLKPGVVCQSRNLMAASLPISKWSVRRYLYDFKSGVYKPSEYFRAVLDSVFPRVRGFATRSQSSQPNRGSRRTPTNSLQLQPGNIVKVKSKEEILRTLDHRGRNRGLVFTPEMERYCGEKLRVLKRLDKMIVEQTGAMRQIPNTVLLEKSYCDGKAHKGCPRNCYCLWREIWLERAQNESSRTVPDF